MVGRARWRSRGCPTRGRASPPSRTWWTNTARPASTSSSSISRARSSARCWSASRRTSSRASVNAEAIARRLGNALVAPVLAYVPEGSVEPPTGHMRYAGTITLPDPWFEKVLEFAARSFKAHGFRDIVFIGDSGENQPGQRRVAAQLNREWARMPVRVHAIEAYYRATTVLRDRLRAEGYAERDLDGHAALLDTALMLAID